MELPRKWIQEENRKAERGILIARIGAAFAKEGPGRVHTRSFTPDAVTQQVIRDVEQEFPSHPGDLTQFDWPTNRKQGLERLEFFLKSHFLQFGKYQDPYQTAHGFEISNHCG